MLCPKCSQPLADRARFCGSCGEPLTVAGNDASVTPPPRGPVGAGATSAGGGAAGGASPAWAAGPGTAAPRLIDRIKNIILSPKTEWPVIETEPTTITQLYKGYVIPLVAFSALMSFVRLSIVGIGFWRMPVLTGLAYALVSFALGLLGLYVFGWLIDMLAPAFSGQRDRRQAVKTAAYAFTPGAIGAVFVLLGGLGRPLHLAAAIWGIYLLYLGLPMLMRSPREKAAGYTAAVIVCALLLFVVFGIIISVLNPMRSFNPFGMNGTAMTRERPAQAAGAWEPESRGNLSGIFYESSSAIDPRVPRSAWRE
jgi:Yip1 domain